MGHNCVKRILLSILALLLPQVYGGDIPICGILNTRPNGTRETTEKYCILFYREITSLAGDEESAEYFQISDALDWNICNDTEPPPHLDLENRLIFVSSENNCSAMERASIVQKYGGAGTLIVEPKLNLRELEDLKYNFTLGFIDNSSYFKIMEKADNETKAGMYSPKDSPLHISLMIIWILAVFSVSVGAFWSGSVRHKLYLSEQCGGAIYEGRQEHLQEPVLPQEETSMNLTPKIVLFFVVMMCTMLLLLYFLYDYLVYVIMGMFCIASGGAMFSCLEPLVSKIPCGACRTPYFNIYIVRGTLEFRQILLLIFSFSLPIAWVVMRKEPWAWILQDILGITFSINVLKVIRLPSLKICTILLCGLVVYDIFFVFITPLITSDGKSIMVEVAEGGASREQLPMVLKVPNFSYSEIADICGLKDNYNLLGFGDILIPGLLVAFTSAFDRQVGTPCHLYYLVNIIGYGSGLVLTFVALYFMSVAQPALLYLVPFTLIPTFITAACRGEFLAMWRGDSDKFESDDGEIDEADSADDNGLPANTTAAAS
ncbi:signal peptide peptidase-like 2B isoform X1 [Palaemon carinicauda]|uniref:signal peptide peptidase-like 2B isoform X1 n=1 Tax=Palaemon carinicauda TaxID=392227 RepID=UPI0035B5C2B9